jgi:hypothetical protein
MINMYVFPPGNNGTREGFSVRGEVQAVSRGDRKLLEAANFSFIIGYLTTRKELKNLCLDVP